MAKTTALHSKNNTQDSPKPRKVWWLVGVLLLSIFVIVQMPASWLVQKFLPDSSYIQQISGNLWQGAAIVKLPVKGNNNFNNSNNLVATDNIATLVWRWQPLALFTGKLGASIDMTSGQTSLQGELRRGFKSWQIKDVSGSIERQTLMTVVDWELPDAPIKVNNLSIALIEDSGFNDVDGELTWVGGELGYPNAGKIIYITLPAMRADILQETQDIGNVIHVNLVDDDNQRLGDLYLDATGMLDVSLTQRLLENMPSYKGNAPADTAVVTVRQPLISGSSNLPNTSSPSAEVN